MWLYRVYRLYRPLSLVWTGHVPHCMCLRRSDQNTSVISQQETVSERRPHQRQDWHLCSIEIMWWLWLLSTVSFKTKLKVKVRMYRLLLPLLAVLVTITQGILNFFSLPSILYLLCYHQSTQSACLKRMLIDIERLSINCKVV